MTSGHHSFSRLLNADWLIQISPYARTVWNPESATRLDSFTWGDVKGYKEVLSGQFMEKAPSSLLFVLFLFWLS